MDSAPGSASGATRDDGYEAVAPAYARLSRKWSLPLAAALVARASVSERRSRRRRRHRHRDRGLGSRGPRGSGGARRRSGPFRGDAGRGSLGPALARPERGVRAHGRGGPRPARPRLRRRPLPVRGVALSRPGGRAARDAPRPGPGRTARARSRRRRTPPLRGRPDPARRARVVAGGERADDPWWGPASSRGCCRDEGTRPLRETPHVALRPLVALVQSAGFERIVTSWSGHEPRSRRPRSSGTCRRRFRRPRVPGSPAPRRRWWPPCVTASCRSARASRPRAAASSTRWARSSCPRAGRWRTRRVWRGSDSRGRGRDTAL